MTQGVFRGRKADLKRFLKSLPAILSGEIPDPTGGGVRALYTRLGMAALAIIRDAFVVKARGGMDAAGLKWAPHAPSTIAHRLRKSGLPTRWRAMKDVGKAYKDIENKGYTATRAKRLRKKTETLTKSFGPIEILRDTGRLFNSLCPAVVRNLDQIFLLEEGSVSVGSNIRVNGHSLAAIHHFGTKHIPARPLWPDWNDWPQEWKDQLYHECYAGISDLIRQWLASRG